MVSKDLLTNTRGGEEGVDVIAELEDRERDGRRMDMGEV